MVEDPDGNPVGLMSPRDLERNTWPPEPTFWPVTGQEQSVSVDGSPVPGRFA
jgi:hypothetical protein